MNFAWIKAHKGIVAGVVLGALVLIYIVSKRNASAGSGLGGALQSAQQGQLQMAQLNAQLAAQGDQTQAQLESQQIAANAQAQHDQDAAASQIALYGLQGHLYEEQLNAYTSEQTNLFPLEEKILNTNPTSLFGHTAEQQTLQNELALLLTQGRAAGSLPPSYTGATPGTSFGVSIPGFGTVGVSNI